MSCGGVCVTNNTMGLVMHAELGGYSYVYTVGFLFGLVYPHIYTYIYIANLLLCPSTSTDGSVVEFSPATREARVRFPVSATFFFPIIFLSLC